MPEVRFCSNCGAPIEPDGTFCANCGLNLSYEHPPSYSGGPMAPPMMASLGLPMMPGAEPPPVPASHEKALGGMAGIILIFVASVSLVMGIIYILVWGWDNDERWNGRAWVDVTVLHWDVIAAGAFLIASFVTGLVAGIMSVRMTRLFWALTGATMLVVGGVIETLWANLEGMFFVVILAAVSLTFVLLARNGFKEPERSRTHLGPIAKPKDGYGWERSGGSTG